MENYFLSRSCATLILLMGLSIASCSKDDEPKPASHTVSNTEFNNKKYNIRNGFIQDEGTVDVFYDDEADDKTHYTYSFILTDGTPDFEGRDVVSLRDGSLVISAVLLSPGTTGFGTGTFEFIDFTDFDDMEEDDLKEEFKNRYFCPLAFVFTDTDSDEVWEDETGFMVSGGSFKVSGTAPNYITEYDLTLVDGKKVKGSFTGKFTILQD